VNRREECGVSISDCGVDRGQQVVSVLKPARYFAVGFGELAQFVLARIRAAHYHNLLSHLS